LDAADNPGAYADVTLYSSSTGTDSSVISVTSVTTDIFSNPSRIIQLYDRLPVTETNYLYRLKATKGSQTEYKVSDDPIYINYSDLLEVATIELRKWSSTSTRFTVATGINYRNLLKEGDKVVVYYIKERGIDSYKTGIFSTDKSVTFTKADLDKAEEVGLVEKDLITGLSLDNDGTDETKYWIYAQAWLEFANGKKKQVANSEWNPITGGAIYGSASYNGQVLTIFGY